MKYLIVTLIVALLTNGGQFYLWNQYMAQTRVKYEQEIQLLNATIEDIGTLVDVYSVRATTFPGQEITDNDLMLVEVPESAITEAFITRDKLEQLKSKYFKLAITPGTLLTTDMVMGKELDNTLREVDLIVDTWSVGLKVGDYVDLEVTLPYGDKYIVLSHVRVEEMNTKTIKAYLTSSQRHVYNSVLVDYYLGSDNGITLNMVKYVEPGIQEPAKETYSLKNSVLSVLTEDPNVLRKIHTKNNKDKRGILEKSLGSVTEEDGAKLAAGRQGAIGNITGAETTWKSEEQRKIEEAKENGTYNETVNTSSNGSSDLQVEKGVVD